MRRYQLYGMLLLLGLTGCQLFSKVDVSEFRTLEIEVVEGQEVNHGSTFEVNLYAVTTKHKRKKLNKRYNVQVSSPYIEQLEWNKLKIIDRPDRFDSRSYPVTLSIQHEAKTLQTEANIHLNYRGDIEVKAEGADGRDGFDGDSGGQTLFGRDGTQGRTGEAGVDGESGDNYVVHIWKDGYEYRVRIEGDSTGVVWKYKSIDCDSVLLYIPGGDGGDGGNGGEGGSGKPGKVTSKKTKDPGNGGQGGNGGDGGRGGEGGSVLIFIHTNARKLADRIRVINYGGTGGEAGRPGEGGVPGIPAKGQSPAKHGSIGELGVDGVNGNDGPDPVISINAFDFSRLAIE